MYHSFRDRQHQMNLFVLRDAFDQWAGEHWTREAARNEIADQRAVMEAQAKIISLLWPPHVDDVVADYSSLRLLLSKLQW